MMKDTNPKDAVGIRKWRQFFVVPRQVLWEVGVGMLEGALKYGRHNYRASSVRASVYCDAAMGHIEQFIEGEDVDQDSGLSHITKAICSLVVLRDAMLNDFWEDDRPPRIRDLEGLREDLQEAVEAIFERYADRVVHHYTEGEDGSPYRSGDELDALVRRMNDTGEMDARLAEERSRAALRAKREIERVAMRKTVRVGAVEQQTTIYEGVDPAHQALIGTDWDRERQMDAHQFGTVGGYPRNGDVP